MFNVAPAEISTMRIDQMAFWLGIAVDFFDKTKRPAAGSAVQALQTQQIDAYVRGFRS